MSVASTNDWGAAVKDGITWAGAADAVAASTVDLGYNIEEALVASKEYAQEEMKEYGKNLKREYRDFMKQASKEAQAGQEAINDAKQQAMNQMNADVENAARSAVNSIPKPTMRQKASMRARAAKKTFSVNYLDKQFKASMSGMYGKPRKVSDTDKNVLK